MAGGGGGGKSAKGGQALNINLTPMIDCTMLLVIFFLLTTEIASSNFQQIDLPTPTASKAKDMLAMNRVIINVLCDPKDPKKVSKFQIEPEEYDPPPPPDKPRTGRYTDVDRMTARLAELLKNSPNKEDFTVVIRCDQRIEMFQMEPVFPCIQVAGIKKVQVAAFRP